MSDPTDLQPMFVCFQSALQGLYARMEQRLQCELQRRDAEYESWRCNMEQMFEQKIQKGRHVGPRISVGCQTHAEETGFSEHSDYGKSSFAKSTVDRSSDNVSFNEWGEAIERCIVVCADLKEQSSETTDDVAMDKSTPLEQSNEPQLDESHSKADDCDSPAERPANAPGTEDSGSNHMTEENFKIDTLMKNSVILSFPAVESDEEVKPVRRGSGRKPSVLKKFCRICKKHFGKSYFKQHMISHTGEKPHKCGSCGKAFTRRRTLIIHLHTSHSVEERDELSRRAMRSVIVCNFCQQSFTDHRKWRLVLAMKRVHAAGELALHLRTHASVNEDFNGAAMKAISGQMARVNGKESNNQEAEHSDAASVEVPSDGELSKPSSTPASDRSSPLPQLVSSSYRADGVLPSKRKDSEEFYCAVCRTRIKRRENFDRHMRAHSDDRLFQCNYCEKRFSARSLQRHLLSHRRDPKPKSKAASLPKIIICNICHRPFYNQDDFEAHVRTHNGAIVFPCGICHQVFPLRAMLDTHIMTHQDANLACGVCGKRFQNASNLETHAKSHR